MLTQTRLLYSSIIVFCFFNETATTDIYTLSLHDALPISQDVEAVRRPLEGAPGSVAPIEPLAHVRVENRPPLRVRHLADRKSTRLNSSHTVISYAVFCLKKKIHTNISILLDSYTEARFPC